MSKVAVDDLDIGGVLAFVARRRAAADRAEADILVGAATFADLHGCDERGRVALRGMEQMVRLGGAGTPKIAEFAPAELGAELNVSTYAAQSLIGDALDLRHRLPMTWNAVQMCLVQAWVGRKIAALTRHLSPHAARYVDEKVAPDAGQVTTGRLLTLVEAAIIKADPKAAEDKARKRREAQGVFISGSQESGIKSAFIRAQAPIVIVFDAVVDRIADALGLLGDTDTKDQRRAKAVGVITDPEQVKRLFAQAACAGTDDDTAAGGEKATGLSPLVSVVLYVHLNQDCLSGAENGVARMEGLGPITIEQAREFTRHAHVTLTPVLDLADTRPVDGYEAPSSLWEKLFLANPVEVFPYGTHLGRRKDLDHTDPYLPPNRGGPPAQTHAGNLGFLGRKHHRIKTFGRWQVAQPFPGVHLWRAPHGALYLVDHKGTRKIRGSTSASTHA